MKSVRAWSYDCRHSITKFLDKFEAIDVVVPHLDLEQLRQKFNMCDIREIKSRDHGKMRVMITGHKRNIKEILSRMMRLADGLSR